MILFNICVYLNCQKKDLCSGKTCNYVCKKLIVEISKNFHKMVFDLYMIKACDMKDQYITV